MGRILFIYVSTVLFMALQSPAAESTACYASAPPVDTLCRVPLDSCSDENFLVESGKKRRLSRGHYLKWHSTVEAKTGSVFLPKKKYSPDSEVADRAKSCPKKRLHYFSYVVSLGLMGIFFIMSFWLAGGIYALIAWLAGWVFSWGLFCAVAFIVAMIASLFAIGYW
jgi:hypothetical protein